MRINLIRVAKGRHIRTPVDLESLVAIEFDFGNDPETEDGARFQVFTGYNVVDTIIVREVTNRVLLTYSDSGNVVSVIGQRWAEFSRNFRGKEKSS